ncbi:MAG: hypothetical protein NZ551_10095 [Microscillaceae bacterium]|nr:hypothetical protein [Microscillaceae bacterium]MDW8461547.1 hypothetical protein [Cytophagales bacterium]
MLYKYFTSKFIISLATLFLKLTSCILLLTYCRSSEKEVQETIQKEQDLLAKVSKISNQKIRVYADNGKRKIVSIELAPQENILEFESEVLTGQAKKDNKTQYSNTKGDIVCEVKYKEEGFKLHTAEGKFLWKVKYKGDKIKIYAQEDNDRNPFEIKKLENGNLKVLTKNVELGQVKYNGSQVIVESSLGNMIIRSYRKAPLAWGVLTIKDIPSVQRYIILAELLALGF